jgi:hypothetical protein
MLDYEYLSEALKAIAEDKRKSCRQLQPLHPSINLAERTNVSRPFFLEGDTLFCLFGAMNIFKVFD